MSTTSTREPAPHPLREYVRAHAENRPGVYRMIGPGDQVLYVGKSIRVRSRLLSYFRADPGEKAAEILGFTERVEWDDHPSEFAALLREFRQIRRLRPPFTVRRIVPRSPTIQTCSSSRTCTDLRKRVDPVDTRSHADPSKR